MSHPLLIFFFQKKETTIHEVVLNTQLHPKGRNKYVEVPVTILTDIAKIKFLHFFRGVHRQNDSFLYILGSIKMNHHLFKSVATGTPTHLLGFSIFTLIFSLIEKIEKPPVRK